MKPLQNPETIPDETGTPQKAFDRRKIKKVITPVAFFVLIPLSIVAGVWFFDDRSYNLVAAAIALIACFPFFFVFEKKQKSSRELMVIAVMTGISVLGRFIFAPLPGFKPVTAIVIIAAISLGGEAGFIIGALSAIVSNIYFGQGPWTPFQMFSWGTLGFLAGMLPHTKLLETKATKIISLTVIGVIGGVLYSMMMDIWTVLAFDGSFNLNLYFAAVISALPWMTVYAVSNVIFLLFLTKPIGQQLDRIKIKYGIF